jgi:hypothetical protein
MYLSISEQEYEDLLRTERAKYLQILEQIIDFKMWGFKQTFVGAATPQPWCVIYDSEWCRVCFTWNIEDRRDYPISHVYYGRLHAPSNEYVILWNGKNCYCWHDIRLALFFLDNVSWQDTAAARKEFKLPTAEEKFRQTSTGKGWSQPEWMARMHLAFWKQYDKKLFELFDLRHPDLWEKYTKFLEEYHKFTDYPPVIYPSLYEVC